ncbi:MAG: MHYT domain-containing protein [Comamonas sp.]
MNDFLAAGELAQTSYQPSLVAVSYAISVLGAFAALTAAQRIRGPRGLNLLNLLLAGVALGGIGVWSMHFTGMLALNLGMGSGYALVETLVSLVAAIGATSAALGFVALNPASTARVVGAGVLLGLGVVFMHYLGMYGMRFPGYIVWTWSTVALSVLLAIAASTAALWLAFRSRSLPVRGVAAAVMGAAVCSMHYTGMAAADFICTTGPADRFAIPKGPLVISAMDLPVLTVMVAAGMAAVIGFDQLLLSMQQGRMRAKA